MDGSSSAAAEEHWCWCCRSKVECSVDPETSELVCSQCGNTFVEIYDPSNEEERPETFIPPTISSPQLPGTSLPRSPSTAPAETQDRAARLNPHSSTFPISSQTTSANMSSPGGGIAFAQPNVPARNTNAGMSSVPLGGSLGSSALAGNLQNVLHHIIGRLHGRGSIGGMAMGAGGIPIPQNEIHGSIGDYAFGNLQNIMNELMERNPSTHGANPTSPDVVKSLRRLTVGTEYRTTEGCSICQDDFGEGDTLVCLPCDHKFHDECIVPWLSKHNTCPICRKTIQILSSKDNQSPTNETGSSNTHIPESTT